MAKFWNVDALWCILQPPGPTIYQKCLAVYTYFSGNFSLWNVLHGHLEEIASNVSRLLVRKVATATAIRNDKLWPAIKAAPSFPPSTMLQFTCLISSPFSIIIVYIIGCHCCHTCRNGCKELARNMRYHVWIFRFICSQSQSNDSRISGCCLGFISTLHTRNTCTHTRRTWAEHAQYRLTCTPQSSSQNFIFFFFVLQGFTARVGNYCTSTVRRGHGGRKSDPSLEKKSGK